MMIKKEGMPAAKHSSSFPEARASSVRTVREILRHSEMLTELLLMFGSPSLFKHFVFAQCSFPVLYFVLQNYLNATGLEITQALQHHERYFKQSSRDLWTTAMNITGSLILVLLGMSHVSSLDSFSSESATREVLPDINHRTSSPSFLYLSLSLISAHRKQLPNTFNLL